MRLIEIGRQFVAALSLVLNLYPERKKVHLKSHPFINYLKEYLILTKMVNVIHRLLEYVF